MGLKIALKRTVLLFACAMLLVPFGGAVANADPVLERFAVTGHITNASGQPVAGARVALELPGYEHYTPFQYAPGPNWGISGTAVTAADGSYTINSVLYGTYRATVLPPHNSRYLLGEVNDVVVSSSRTLDVSLSEGARYISGTVTGMNNQPVKEALVQFVSDTGKETYAFLTDANGYYQINAEPGVYNKVKVANVQQIAPDSPVPYWTHAITDTSVSVNVSSADQSQNFNIPTAQLSIFTGSGYRWISVEPVDKSNAKTSLTGGSQTASIDYTDSQSSVLEIYTQSSGSAVRRVEAGGTYIVCASYGVAADCEMVTPSINTNTNISLGINYGSTVPTGLAAQGQAYPFGHSNLFPSKFSTNQRPSLSWQPVSGAVSYNVYRNGQLVANTSSTSYQDNTVTVNASYLYTVTSLDASSVESLPSAHVTVLYDAVAPVAVRADLNYDSLVPDILAILRAVFLDDMDNIERVEYYFDNNDPGLGNATIVYGVTYFDFSDTSFSVNDLSDGSHTVHVRAKDVAGNWSTTLSDTFTVTGSDNTGAGTGVEVTPGSGITLMFDNVTSGGDTTAVINNNPPTPPGGFKLGTPPTYYDISTTATFSGDVTVCLEYDPTTINTPENMLRLMHFDGSGWDDITTSVDTVNNVICGITNSFSGFAVVQSANFQGLIDEIEAMNLRQGITNSLDAKLQNAQQAFAANTGNDFNTVKNKLQAVNNEIEAQRGSALTSTQADTLSAMTTELLSYFP